MRNLIIKRRSSPFGQDAVLHIYATPANGDVSGDEILWYDLGSVSDGQTVVIPISDEPIKIYIADDLSAQMQRCEYCQIPAGNNDLFISGKRVSATAGSNPFHFDENTDNPASRCRTIGIIVAVILLVGALIAFPFVMKLFSKSDAPVSYESKVFSKDGIQITLTEEYQELDDTEGFEAGFITENASIRIKKEPYNNNSSISTFEFAQYYISIVLGENRMPYQEHGLILYEYTEVNPYDGRSYAYLMVFEKGPDAFWIVEFSTLEENADAMRERFLDYAKSICFPGNAI